jgi:hypothetical protein
MIDTMGGFFIALPMSKQARDGADVEVRLWPTAEVAATGQLGLLLTHCGGAIAIARDDPKEYSPNTE